MGWKLEHWLKWHDSEFFHRGCDYQFCSRSLSFSLFFSYFNESQNVFLLQCLPFLPSPSFSFLSFLSSLSCYHLAFSLSLSILHHSLGVLIPPISFHQHFLLFPYQNKPISYLQLHACLTSSVYCFLCRPIVSRFFFLFSPYVPPSFLLVVHLFLLISCPGLRNHIKEQSFHFSAPLSIYIYLRFRFAYMCIFFGLYRLIDTHVPVPYSYPPASN